MKFAIVACLILNPLVSARYLPRAVDGKRSSEIHYLKRSSPASENKFVNSTSDVEAEIFSPTKDDTESDIEPQNTTTEKDTRLILAEAAKGYQYLQDQFQLKGWNFPDYFCEQNNREMNEVLSQSYIIRVQWRTFTKFIAEKKMDYKKLFCESHGGKPPLKTVSEIESQNWYPSVSGNKFVNSTSDVEAEIITPTKDLYTAVVEQYLRLESLADEQFLRLLSLFEANGWNFPDYLCGPYNRDFEDAVDKNYEVKQQWVSFAEFLEDNHLDDNELYCNSYREKSPSIPGSKIEPQNPSSEHGPERKNVTESKIEPQNISPLILAEAVKAYGDLQHEFKLRGWSHFHDHLCEQNGKDIHFVMEISMPFEDKCRQFATFMDKLNVDYEKLFCESHGGKRPSIPGSEIEH